MFPLIYCCMCYNLISKWGYSIFGVHRPCILKVSGLLGCRCFFTLDTSRPIVFRKNSTCVFIFSGSSFFTPICLLLPFAAEPFTRNVDRYEMMLNTIVDKMRTLERSQYLLWLEKVVLLCFVLCLCFNCKLISFAFVRFVVYVSSFDGVAHFLIIHIPYSPTICGCLLNRSSSLNSIWGLPLASSGSCSRIKRLCSKRKWTMNQKKKNACVEFIWISWWGNIIFFVMGTERAC